MVLREGEVRATMRIGLCQPGMDMVEEVVVGVIGHSLLLLLRGQRTNLSLLEVMEVGEDVPDQQDCLVVRLRGRGDSVEVW
jgi:hypothetical protein